MPSGDTPQRRKFEYPRELMKLQNRYELLDSLRRHQQEELHPALEEEEEEEDQEEDDDKRSQVDLVCLFL